MTGPLLEVDGLEVVFTARGRRDVRAVDRVSFAIEAGETVGLVGESGCGKSVSALAVLGLLPRRGVRISGSIRFDGQELVGLGDDRMRRLRGRDVAMIFQDPMTSLNPVVPIGIQIAEVLERHQGMDRRDALREATELLARVGIPDPARRIGEYPHQLSGGMRQRALIATGLACRPQLIIADEPTTALDVTIQAQILELLRELVVETNTALLLITHDLGVVAGMCDRVNVMYAGRIVECASRHELFAAPRHPYTGGLLASVPRLDLPRGVELNPIPGSPRDTIPWARGCAFAPRCHHRVEGCTGAPPELAVDPTRPDHSLRCVNPLDPERPVPAGAADAPHGGEETR